MAKATKLTGKAPRSKRPAKKAARRSYPGETLMSRRTIVKGVEILDPKAVASVGALTDAPDLGALGLVEIKFTAAEEATLSEPVPIDRVRVLPTGQPYLPHTEYTRWFNRAFGRGGWSLKPCSIPAMTHGSIVVSYVLYIHGKPAAFAQGENDFNGPSAFKSYGEAIEATVASGLRRCAKHLGIGLELWDRVWCDDYQFEHCIRVKVERFDKREKKSYLDHQWRRKVDRPLPGEQGRQTSRSQTSQTARPAAQAPAHEANGPVGGDDVAPADDRPSTGRTAASGPPVSEAQVRRLFAIVRNSGHTVEAVKAWLKARYGVSDSAEIRRADYDEICEAIESPEGRLPR